MIGVHDRVVTEDVLVCDKKESPCTARGIADSVPWAWSHDVDDGADERSGSEVLTGFCAAATDSFSQQALVGVSLHVGIES